MSPEPSVLQDVTTVPRMSGDEPTVLVWVNPWQSVFLAYAGSSSAESGSGDRGNAPVFLVLQARFHVIEWALNLGPFVLRLPAPRRSRGSGSLGDVPHPAASFVVIEIRECRILGRRGKLVCQPPDKLSGSLAQGIALGEVSGLVVGHRRAEGVTPPEPNRRPSTGCRVEWIAGNRG